jgi:hypothetical protein
MAMDKMTFHIERRVQSSRRFHKDFGHISGKNRPCPHVYPIQSDVTELHFG